MHARWVLLISYAPFAAPTPRLSLLLLLLFPCPLPLPFAFAFAFAFAFVYLYANAFPTFIVFSTLLCMIHFCSLCDLDCGCMLEGTSSVCLVINLGFG